ncbi:MAG: hypothetical protein FWE83_11335 [Oscillospiraceae bacterium]|nr:hypothetical protein [Oscillospiraceae bacterium]
MSLSKNKKMSLAIALIVLGIYNTIVFVIPFNRGGGFWTGYGFSMLAIVMTAAVSLFAFKPEGLRSKIYGLPLISVAWRYLVVQMIIGLAQILLDFIPIPFQYGLVVNIILLGLCLIGLITVEIGKDEIVRIDEKVKEKVFYIKALQVDVETMADRTTDESAKKALQDLAETIRYSDPMSNPQLAAVENKIEAKVNALTDSITDIEATKTQCNELQQLLTERNRKCKILK